MPGWMQVLRLKIFFLRMQTPNQKLNAMEDQRQGNCPIFPKPVKAATKNYQALLLCTAFILILFIQSTLPNEPTFISPNLPSCWGTQHLFHSSIRCSLKSQYPSPSQDHCGIKNGFLWCHHQWKWWISSSFGHFIIEMHGKILQYYCFHLRSWISLSLQIFWLGKTSQH